MMAVKRSRPSDGLKASLQLVELPPRRPDVGHFLHDGKNFPLGEFSVQCQGQLGNGAFGVVYAVLIRSTTADSPWEVSCARKDINLDKEDKKYLGDLGVLQQIAHEHIVPFFGFRRHEAELQLFMERMAGSLADALKLANAAKTSIPSEILAAVAVASVKALSALQDSELNALHNDLKPDNILLSYHGVVKLADFGLATKLNPSGYVTDGLSAMKYKPPENLDGSKKQHDCRADIWALGLTLLELAIGKYPIGSTNLIDVQVQIISQDRMPSAPAHLSANVRVFIDTCLQKNCNARPWYLKDAREGGGIALKNQLLMFEPLLSAAAVRDWFASLRSVSAPLVAAPAVVVAAHDDPAAMSVDVGSAAAAVEAVVVRAMSAAALQDD